MRKIYLLCNLPFLPFFCGKLILLKLDIDKFKSHLKEDLRLWRIDSDSIEYDPIEIIEKDHEYLKTKINLCFLADKSYESNISQLLYYFQNDKESYTNSKCFDVEILNNQGNIIENNFYKNMILPINSELIYIDDQYSSKKW